MTCKCRTCAKDFFRPSLSKLTQIFIKFGTNSEKIHFWLFIFPSAEAANFPEIWTKISLSNATRRANEARLNLRAVTAKLAIFIFWLFSHVLSFKFTVSYTACASLALGGLCDLKFYGKRFSLFKLFVTNKLSLEICIFQATAEKMRHKTLNFPASPIRRHESRKKGILCA